MFSPYLKQQLGQEPCAPVGLLFNNSSRVSAHTRPLCLIPAPCPYPCVSPMKGYISLPAHYLWAVDFMAAGVGTNYEVGILMRTGPGMWTRAITSHVAHHSAGAHNITEELAVSVGPLPAASTKPNTCTTINIAVACHSELLSYLQLQPVLGCLATAWLWPPLTSHYRTRNLLSAEHTHHK